MRQCNFRFLSRLCGAILLALAPSLLLAGEAVRSRAFLLDVERLQLTKQLWTAGDVTIQAAMRRLLRTADSYLTAEPVNVVDSAIMAPSGDPHDYAGYAAYWWPNPDTPDGLPWVFRDGFINQANYEDFSLLQKLSRYTEATSLAYYFTGDERYAAKTAELLRAWFLDEATYMNPRNEYSHMRPDIAKGYYDVAGFGNRLPAIIDAAGLIESSSSWTAADRAGLTTWMRTLRDWASTAPIANLEFREPSNHGTNFDFLQTLFSAYVGDHAAAEDHALHYFSERMTGQIDPDGSNPLEMKRANNLLYHRYNLGRALDLAAVASKSTGLDGFQYQLEDGRGLRLALDFLIPYMTGEQPWDRFEETEFPLEPAEYYLLLRRAAVWFQDPELLRIAASLPAPTSTYVDLTYPVAAVDRSRADRNHDGQIDVADIDLLSAQLRLGTDPNTADLNGDRALTQQDYQYWTILAAAIPGDADWNGHFDTTDLVLVFQSGSYEDQVEDNSGWATGDWDGDGDFNSTDLIVAFAAGGYTNETASALPRKSAAGVPPTPNLLPVPEPAGAMLLLWGLFLSAIARRGGPRRRGNV